MALKGKYWDNHRAYQRPILDCGSYIVMFPNDSWLSFLVKGTRFRFIPESVLQDFFETNPESVASLLNKGSIQSKEASNDVGKDSMMIAKTCEMFLEGTGENEAIAKRSIFQKASFVPSIILDEERQSYIDVVKGSITPREKAYASNKYIYVLRPDLLPFLERKVYDAIWKNWDVLKFQYPEMIHNHADITYVTLKSIHEQLPEHSITEICDALSNLYEKRCILLYDKAPRHRIKVKDPKNRCRDNFVFTYSIEKEPGDSPIKVSKVNSQWDSEYGFLQDWDETRKAASAFFKKDSILKECPSAHIIEISPATPFTFTISNGKESVTIPSTKQDKEE